LFKVVEKNIISDKVGNTLSIPGPGNVSYIHCDVTNEEEIKVS
jgi:hypothetical protein